MSNSQSKRAFTIQVHPIIETVILRNLDDNTTSEQVMSKYASITAEKYGFDKKKLLGSMEGVVPYTPVRSVGVYHCYNCGKLLTCDS
jgi:hypothetical protein